MPCRIDIWVECPKCGVEAYDLDDLDKYFGTRISNGKTIPQSWCRKCRSNGK